MKSSNFGRVSTKFLVADDAIGLQKVILGLPFLNQTQAKMYFHPQKSTVKTLLDTSQGQRYVNLQLKNNKPLKS